LKILKAADLLNKTAFSNYDIHENINGISTYKCPHCKYEIEIRINSLDKHRFLNYSNLRGIDKTKFDFYSLSFLPFTKVKPKGQNLTWSKSKRLILNAQRFFLFFLTGRQKILKASSDLKYYPDSFLDFYCPKCNTPVRIYYMSFIGGRQGEVGYELVFVLTM
jgi:hypothetical protein